MFQALGLWSLPLIFGRLKVKFPLECRTSPNCNHLFLVQCQRFLEISFQCLRKFSSFFCLEGDRHLLHSVNKSIIDVVKSVFCLLIIWRIWMCEEQMSAQRAWDARWSYVRKSSRTDGHQAGRWRSKWQEACFHSAKPRVHKFKPWSAAPSSVTMTHTRAHTHTLKLAKYLIWVFTYRFIPAIELNETKTLELFYVAEQTLIVFFSFYISLWLYFFYLYETVISETVLKKYI